MADASWLLLLFWRVLYVQRGRGFTDQMVAQWAWIPFATADRGVTAGGWFSPRLIQRGRPIVKVRRYCLLGLASLMALTLAGLVMPAGQPYWTPALFSVATVWASGVGREPTHPTPSGGRRRLSGPAEKRSGLDAGAPGTAGIQSW